MSARYEIRRSFDGYYSFTLRTSASTPILTGNECSTLALCRAGIASARIICDSPFEDLLGLAGEKTEVLKNPKYVISRERGGKYICTLVSRNGKPLAHGPSCGTVGAATRALEVARREARYAQVDEKVIDAGEGKGR